MKMDERDLLIELEEPLRRIHCGINAIELMMYGLGRVKDPRADGIMWFGAFFGILSWRFGIR